MKSFLRIACVLLCVLIVTGCTNTEKYPWNLTEADSVYENASEDVSIELRPENLTTKQGWFIMRNRGNLYVRFDSSFYLLVKKNGTWHHMDADTAVLTQYETKVDSINGYYNYYFDWEPVYSPRVHTAWSEHTASENKRIPILPGAHLRSLPPPRKKISTECTIPSRLFMSMIAYTAPQARA